MNFNVLDKFSVSIIDPMIPNSFIKVRVDSNNLLSLLNFLKNNAEFDFDILISIIAVDLGVDANNIELIYDLYSSKNCKNARISVLVDRNSPHICSIVNVFKSAYFDECEIFDLFGVIFDNNPNLKRLLMPKGWIGYPLKKDYVEDDSRLSWSVDK